MGSLKARAGLFCSPLEPQSLALCLALNRCSVRPVVFLDLTEVNLTKEAALKEQRHWPTDLEVGFEFASVIESLLNLGQVSALSQLPILGLSFPIAELENWPKAREETKVHAFWLSFRPQGP